MTDLYRMVEKVALWTALVVSLAGIGNAGTIEGTVLVSRKLTKRRVNPAIGAYDRGTVVELKQDTPEDALAFERERVIIYLEGDLGSRPGPPAIAKMEQENRRFVPDTLWVPAGSVVSFPNLDPIFHNVFSLSKPKSFDLGNYPKDHTRTVTFPKPGIVFVNCHLHPNMSGVIVVTPNGWGARADADGKFTIADVPQGSYKIVAWHKAAGFFHQQVDVGDKPVPVEFIIPLGPEK